MRILITTLRKTGVYERIRPDMYRVAKLVTRLSRLNFTAIAFLVVALFFVVSRPAYAQTSLWYAPTVQEYLQKVNGGDTNQMFGERYTHAQVYWIAYSLIDFLGGQNAANCIATNGTNIGAIVNCLNKPNALLNSPILNVAMISDSILTTKPASGVQWLADTASHMKLIPEANAQQGFGFRTLSPTLALWAISRNFAYAFLVIVIVILAFMIMFRVKTSPQTVVTIQSAIPKVAVALILITFSYAIAGLIVDLAFLAQGVIAAVVANSNLSTLGPSNVAQIFALINNPFQGMMAYGAVMTICLLVVLIVGGLVTAVIGIVTLGLSTVVSVIAGFLIALILLIAVFIAFLRVAFLLLKTYVSIFLLVIAAPFIILFGTVSPGFGFTGWLKQMIANMSVFVVATVIIIFAHVFTLSMLDPNSLQGQIINGIGSFANPYGIKVGTVSGGSGRLPGMTGIDTGWLGLLVGLVTILSIPQFANAIRSFIATGRTAPFGFGVGEAFGPVVGAGVASGRNFIGERLGEAEIAQKFAGTYGSASAIYGRPINRAYRTAQGILGRIRL